MKRKRSYVQTARRDQQEQTRMRIVEALVELHEEVGPRNTTIAAVADRAGVQRLTVYRHFDDESAMLMACSSHWAMSNPPPDVGEWEGLADREERVFTALLAVNHYYARTVGMLAKVYRDVSEVEALGPIMKGFDDHFKKIADTLALDLANGVSNVDLRTVARHLTRFTTWQSFSIEGLSEEEIARIELRLLKAV